MPDWLKKEKLMKRMLSAILALTLVFSVIAGTAYAGCGKKVTNNGTLNNLDSAKKIIVVGETKLTVTPSTKAVDSDGKTTELANLVGKNVTVISEHSKVDSVTAKN